MKKVKYEYSVDCPKCGHHLILTNEEEKRCFLQSTLQVRESSPETWTPFKDEMPQHGDKIEFYGKANNGHEVIMVGVYDKYHPLSLQGQELWTHWRPFTPPLVKEKDECEEAYKEFMTNTDDISCKTAFKAGAAWRAALERKEKR